jgi:hypothetical protein
VRVKGAKSSDTDLELVGDLADESFYLPHQTLHRLLCSSLQESCDSENGNRDVPIRDEHLQVGIARDDCLWVGDRDPIEGPHRRESKWKLGRGAELLKDIDCGREIATKQ